MNFLQDEVLLNKKISAEKEKYIINLNNRISLLLKVN